MTPLENPAPQMRGGQVPEINSFRSEFSGTIFDNPIKVNKADLIGFPILNTHWPLVSINGGLDHG